MINEKHFGEIVKLADKIDTLMDWESDEERRDFFRACGLVSPEEEDNNCIS